MRNFLNIACLLWILFGQQARGEDFKTHYLARTQNPSDEFSLLLHLFQTQLDSTLASSYYHRFLLHSLLAIPPQPLPALLQLLPPLTLPADKWAQRKRLPLTDLVVGDSTAEMLPDDDAAHTATHRRVRAVLQVLWDDRARLQKLQTLAQRMPTTRQYDVAQQAQASTVLRSLVLDVSELQELSNAERGLLEQLVRDQQRQRRVRQALIGGGALAAAVLLGYGVSGARKRVARDWQALWSKRVLGMHLGYSLTTLAALYPAWQLGKAVKQHVQRVWQTPADLRQHSDYRIAYLMFLSNPHNLQHQQEMLHTLNRCLQHLLPLFAERELSVKINIQHNRYRIVRQANHLSIAVPYSVSNDVPSALEQVIAHYYEGKLPPHILSQDIKYCRHDKA